MPDGSAITGIALGLLIGLVTGPTFVFMLRSLLLATTWVGGLQVIGEMLAIPTFWFGGPWLATKVLTGLAWEAALPAYASALALVFTLVVIIPIIRFIKRM